MVFSNQSDMDHLKDSIRYKFLPYQYPKDPYNSNYNSLLHSKLYLCTPVYGQIYPEHKFPDAQIEVPTQYPFTQIALATKSEVMLLTNPPKAYSLPLMLQPT